MQRGKTVNKLDISEKDHVVNHEAKKGQKLEPRFLFWPLRNNVQHLVNLTVFKNELNVGKFQLESLVVLFKRGVWSKCVQDSYFELHILLQNVLVETVQELS